MRYIILFIIPVILSSCISKSLTKVFNSKQIPLYYLHDKEPIDCAKKNTVNVNFNDNNVLKDDICIKRVKSSFIPLIIFNHIQNEFNLSVGQNVLDPYYGNFFNDAIYTESTRTGCFSIIDENNAEYTLNIELKECDSNSKFIKRFTLLFLGFYYIYIDSEGGSPTQTDLVFNVELSKENKTILEKDYVVNYEQPLISKYQVNRYNCLGNMAESLSYATKEAIELIIQDMNNILSIDSASLK